MCVSSPCELLILLFTMEVHHLGRGGFTTQMNFIREEGGGRLLREGFIGVGDYFLYIFIYIYIYIDVYVYV